MTNLTSNHDVCGTIVNSRFLTDKVMKVKSERETRSSMKLNQHSLTVFLFTKGGGTFSV